MGGASSLRIQHWHRERIALILLVGLGLGFFLANANYQLAQDDLGWLRGQPPTVFDRYRLVPFLLFATLHSALGPSAPAALAMIFCCHALNGLMVHQLVKNVLGDTIAGLAAATVFLINPITLGTLTWISCFSYVLGTMLVLTSLLCVRRANLPAARYPFLWLALALAGFAGALLSSHVTLFVPVLHLVLSYLQSQRRRGLLLFGVGAAMAVLTALLVYGFGEYGVDAMEMASPGFALAWTSTVLASGPALFLAYPLSFLTRVQDVLRFCLAEPMRWMLTTGVVAAGLILCRGKRRSGQALALAVSYGALITPYIMRLYLTPDAVNYHISYVLSGRVFYLPFTVIALGWGLAVARLLSAVRGRKWSWALLFMPLAAYVHALWLYSPADFAGLNVTRDPDGPLPARWNPFDKQEPLWLLVATVVLVGLWFARRAMDRRGSTPAAGTDAREDRP